MAQKQTMTMAIDSDDDDELKTSREVGTTELTSMTVATPSATGAASMTRLPPSPEATSVLQGSPPTDEFSLNDGETPPVMRLRSVARYSSFQPQVIACSTPLQATYFEEYGRAEGDATSRDDSLGRGGTSVGAVAGPQGVVLFHVSRPNTPLVVLSHACPEKSGAGSASSLAFQSSSSDSLLLAAARGSGVLVWDASGQSLSPLLTRLAMRPTVSSSDHITSINWMKSPALSLLATTDAANACLWDLRTSLRTNSRPSLRLGKNHIANVGRFVVEPLVQIACSNRDQVATLDAGGAVNVFDVRMTDRSSHDSVGEVSSFSAFRHAGIGLEFLPTNNNEGIAWVTWGLDAPRLGAVVKVWKGGVEPKGHDNPDSYWFMDGSPNNLPMPSTAFPDSARSVDRHFQQIAQFSTPYLACARVAPGPACENQIVTVGLNPDSGITDAPGWHAEVWQLNDSSNSDRKLDSSVGAEKVTSFVVVNDNPSASMIGSKETMGSLRGAELALEPSPFVSEPVGDKYHGMDLVLCCLSDKGYVTTHPIFESQAGSANSRKEGLVESPTLARSSRSLTGRSFVVAGKTRVYPDNVTITSVRDAASMIKSYDDSGPMSGFSTKSVSQNRAIALEQPVTPPSPHVVDWQYFASGNEIGLDEPPAEQDAATTQFDMDIPGTYGAATQVQESDLGLVEATSSSLALLTSNDNRIKVGIPRSNNANRIDKTRVPCPRLCGGSFSPGIGGLVCFHNGEVRRMWSWYERTYPRHRSQSTEARGGPSSLQNASNATKKSATGGDASVFISTPQEGLPSRQESPRTLQDLEEMLNQARSSQWRSDESSGGDTSIDDQSDESVDESISGDDDDEAFVHVNSLNASREKPPGSPSNDLDRDVTNSKAPAPRTPGRGKPFLSSAGRPDGASPDRAFLGPTSDLVPVCYISRRHDDLALSGQRKALAQEWRLGAWNIAEDEEIEPSFSEVLSGETEENTSKDSKDCHGWGWEYGTSSAWAGYQVPTDTDLQMSPTRGDNSTNIPHVRSDPMLVKLSPLRQQRNSRHSYSVASDDEPVHDGAYSVRPNRKESLVFLRKLVTHQRGQQMQTMISPPDSPLLPSKMPLTRGKKSLSANAILQTRSPTSVLLGESEHLSSNDAVLGVYALAKLRAPSRAARRRGELLCETCLHNSEVCLNVGQEEKASVWKLLSQMAEGLLEDDHDNFNGWGGAYGGALGHDLVASFLDYYEAQGDVQMLATMVCVLSGGKRTQVARGFSLLPSSHQDRFNTYIRRYAEILFGWNLMSLRAELNKFGGPPTSESDSGTIDLIVWCSICHQEAILGTGICKQCSIYAYRCAICDIAVRGLFTVCDRCGHGGHASHLALWFKDHIMCPTGCGCVCLLNAG